MTRRTRRKLWSVPRIRDPRYPGLMLRVTELDPGGNLYVVRMAGGRQRMTSLRQPRSSFGSTRAEQEQAVRALALDVIESLANGGTVEDARKGTSPDLPRPGEPLTLGQLVSLYAQHGLHGRAETYQRDQPRKIQRVVDFLGADRTVASLSKSDIERFEVHRRGKDGVIGSTIHGDVTALSIAINWATRHPRRDGSFLVDRNPLDRYTKLVKQPEKPNRPVASEGYFLGLREAAAKLPSAFKLALDLAWHTGHRISAISGLRWADIDFEVSQNAPHGRITWRAEFDKMDHEHTVPMHPAARHALLEARDSNPGIARAWVFPSPDDPTKRRCRSWFRRALYRAERMAEIPHEKGRGWHAFRRAWATRRKHFPLKDVAAAGGWQDTETVLAVYTHTDSETIRDVVTGA